MRTYRTYLTIRDPNRVVLRDLPFDVGQRVEVLLITENQVDKNPAPDLRVLLKETQAQPYFETLSDADIADEIAAYRRNLASRSAV